MELSSHEVEIPIPLNSTYGGGGAHGGGHMIHHDHNHHHMITSSGQFNGGPSPPIHNTSLDSQATNLKKTVKYRECLKNHAAAMGGNATDGCGEFMPSGEEGSIEALTCSACNCHRNFHRKEIEGENNILSSSCDCVTPPHFNRRKILLGHHKNIDALGYPTGTGTLVPSIATVAPHHQMIMSYNMGGVGVGGVGGGHLPSESDEQDDHGGGPVMARPHQQLVKKRFRTKFSQEQKEKMLNFAEKVGWKIQKQEEAVVQQFCQEIGVKRRVLKVWMHNNKHNLAKKNSLVINTTSTTPTVAVAVAAAATTAT